MEWFPGLTAADLGSECYLYKFYTIGLAIVHLYIVPHLLELAVSIHDDKLLEDRDELFVFQCTVSMTHIF